MRERLIRYLLGLNILILFLAVDIAHAATATISKISAGGDHTYEGQQEELFTL